MWSPSSPLALCLFTSSLLPEQPYPFYDQALLLPYYTFHILPRSFQNQPTQFQVTQELSVMASESLNVVEFKEIAVLAAAFRELFAAIRGAVKAVPMFRSLFETLEATCEEIKPVLHDMEMFNMILDHPPNELKRIHDLIENGTKCSKMRWIEL